MRHFFWVENFLGANPNDLIYSTLHNKLERSRNICNGYYNNIYINVYVYIHIKVFKETIKDILTMYRREEFILLNKLVKASSYKYKL